MKKIKLLPIIIMLFSAITLVSCDGSIEPLDSELNQSPEDSEGGSTTGDYWPMAVNNSWTFKQNGVTQPPMKIISTESINGNTYYKYDTFVGMSTNGTDFEGTVWTKKVNGTYYVRQSANTPQIPGQPSITISPIEIIILKDFLEVNQTWTQSIMQTTTIEGIPPIQSTISLTGKILEKNAIVTVNGVSYENVIKAEVIQNTQGVSNTNYYWFAKNIGLIKFQNLYLGTTNNNDLVTYSVN